MKKFLTCFTISILLFAAMVVAQEPSNAEALPDAGMTPDSMLYFLDVALDNIQLALTFNPEKKVAKGLEIAEERLAEVKVMAAEGNTEGLTKAENEHGKTLSKVKDKIKELSDTNEETELEKEMILEEKVNQHQKKVEMVKNEIEISIKIKGDVSESTQKIINAILDNLDQQAEGVIIEIKEKQGDTKIKITQHTGESEQEIETRIKKKISDDEKESDKEDEADDDNEYDKENETDDDNEYDKEDETDDNKEYDKEDETSDNNKYDKENNETSDDNEYDKEDETSNDNEYDKEDNETSDDNKYDKEDKTSDKNKHDKEGETSDDSE